MNKKFKNSRLFIIAIIAFGILTMFLPLTFGDMSFIQIAPFIGVIAIVIGISLLFFEVLKKYLTKTLHDTKVMKSIGIESIGLIGTDINELQRDILDGVNKIDIILNSKFISRKLDFFVISLLQNPDNRIRVVFTNGNNNCPKNNDYFGSFSKVNSDFRKSAVYNFINSNKGFSENIICKYSKFDSINSLIILGNKVLVIYHNDFQNGDFLYTIVESSNINKEFYYIFDRCWNDSLNINDEEVL